MSPTDSFTGQATPSAAADHFSALQFVIRQHLAGVRTAMLVQVKGVSNDGGVTPVGTVNVQPLVHQIDGQGEIVAHGIVYGMPYLRIQGGTNAVILDPQVGDIGLAVMADRDISAVVATKAASAPGSSRRNNFSDGLYLGGFCNGTPTQYVQFNSSGVTVLSPNNVTIKAPQIKLDGQVEITGAATLDSTAHVKGAQTNDSTVTASGEVKGNGIALSTHTHSGVQTGGGTSGPPVP